MKSIGIVAIPEDKQPEYFFKNRRIAWDTSERAHNLGIGTPVCTKKKVQLPTEINATEIEPFDLEDKIATWASNQKLDELLVMTSKSLCPQILQKVREAIRNAGVKIKVYPCREIEQYEET